MLGGEEISFFGRKIFWITVNYRSSWSLLQCIKMYWRGEHETKLKITVVGLYRKKFSKSVIYWVQCQQLIWWNSFRTSFHNLMFTFWRNLRLAIIDGLTYMKYWSYCRSYFIFASAFKAQMLFNFTFVLLHVVSFKFRCNNLANFNFWN